VHQPANRTAPRPRPRRWRNYSVTGIAGLTLLVSQCAPATQCAPASASVSGLSPALQQVVNLTNQHRAAAGLPALTIDQRLVNAAQAHSDDMAAHNTMSHTGSDGSNPGQRISAAGYGWRAWAENVAAGYPDASSVDQGWWNSPGHQANMLSTSITQIGVGLDYSATGVPYWTQDFGRPG
jgi:uncharacterized protein YkwD